MHHLFWKRDLEKNKIEPVIGKKFQFENLLEAVVYMEKGLHIGKIVVTL